MSSPVISLPCTSHRDCAYHRNRNASSPLDVPTDKDRAAVNTTTVSPIATSTSSTSKKRTSITPLILAPCAPIQTLSTELILAITGYLTTIEQVCLALTCKTFAVNLGSILWAYTSKAKGAGWGRHDEFLDVLHRDLDEEYWRCTDCVLLHPRVKPAQKQKQQTTVSPIIRTTLKTVFWTRRSEQESGLRLGITGDPLYTLSSPLVEAIMHRHFSGPSYGACLNALKCRGTRYFPISPLTNVVLDYDFTSKIVLDRLLLRSTYTFRAQCIMPVTPLDKLLASLPFKVYKHPLDKLLVSLLFKVCKHPMYKLLASLPFKVCKHQNLASVFTLHTPITGVHTTAKERRIESRCSYCPTQWILRGVTLDEIRLYVYQNLGEGRSVEDSRWKFVAQPMGRRMKLYPWGEQDVEEAFEWIFCSTMEEFRRQLEKSDGMGDWYDLTLMRRAYRTLLESVGLAL